MEKHKVKPDSKAFLLVCLLSFYFSLYMQLQSLCYSVCGIKYISVE